MTLTIISDVHNDYTTLTRLLKRCRGSDCFLFLGDGYNHFVEACRSEGLPYLAVRGNCDFVRLCEDAPETIVTEFGGKRFLLTHGHRFGVKCGTDALLKKAIDENVDVALFGHTHEPYAAYYPEGLSHKILLLNPGSLGEPSGAVPRFATIEIRNGVILENLAEFY